MAIGDGLSRRKRWLERERRSEKRGSQQLRGLLPGPATVYFAWGSNTHQQLSGFENAGAGLYRNNLTQTHVHTQLNNSRGGEGRRKELVVVEKGKKAAQGNE